MASPVYENLWNRLDENFMTAPRDAEGNPQPSFIKFLELVYAADAVALSFADGPGGTI